MNNRKWLIHETDSEKCARLVKSTGLLPLTVRLLLDRGMDTPEKINGFLDKYGIVLHDPMLMKDMDKAVARISAAIKNREHICIYGDYDVDGVTSTVLLYTYLRSKGLECEYFIPERLSEGYGLSLPVIEKMKGRVDLIITVDTGVTAIAEAEYAKSLGIDMVITDHHSCRDVLPEAAAVVNPHREDCPYPFKNLAGVGVVFKLLCALEGDSDEILSRYSDIIAVGTVADVMPIIGENRRITAVGLKKLADTDNIGLLALMRRAGVIKPNGVKKVSSATVGYVLAPRINAAGRIAFASRAVELLLSENEAEADLIAEELCEINKQRQATEQKIYDQAVGLIEEKYTRDAFIVLGYEGWHQGVIGVVASKIAEKYSRPCILFSIDGDTAKGSGRSIKGFSLMDALSSCGDILSEYGGHELAAGLSIESGRIDEFREKINAYAAPLINVTDSSVPIEIDCEADFSDISAKGIEELLLLEPFGLANPQPVLLLRGAVISGLTPLSMGKHIRFRLSGKNGQSINAVYFGMSADAFPFCDGDRCDAVFTADMNDFMGNRTPQLFIKCIAPSQDVLPVAEAAEAAYERLYNGSVQPGDEKEIPNLSDFRTVFRYLRRTVGHDGKLVSFFNSREKMLREYNEDISPCKLRIIIDVLAEQKLIERMPHGCISAFVKILPTTEKINLDDSALLARMRGNIR